ncbi:MAG: hypothetical protein H6621_08540 [Halobacteriovoraceae bacterium]|nr:hypothetical protein [Halobacteriovoraceae bacterium]MCB9095100.1 hypothetical protein [Halobacteriovoraceae bacterium]
MNQATLITLIVCLPLCVYLGIKIQIFKKKRKDSDSKSNIIDKYSKNMFILNESQSDEIHDTSDNPDKPKKVA